MKPTPYPLPLRREAFLLLLLLLAGCTQNAGRLDSSSPTANTSHPLLSSLTVPHWLPGYHWEYRTEHNLWENYTVKAEGTYNGQLAYKTQQIISPADNFGQTASTIWYDKASLGAIAEHNNVVDIEFSPPAGQTFPLENRTVSYSLKSSDGYHETHHINITMLGWDSITVPAGVMTAIKIKMFDVTTDTTNYDWFSPKIMNDVEFTSDDGPYRLVSWEAKPGSVV